MSMSFLFWLLMILWLIFGLWNEYVPGQPYPFQRGAYSFLMFILLGILGWAQFGAPVR